MKNCDFGLPPNMMFFLRIEDGLFRLTSEPGGELKKVVSSGVGRQNKRILYIGCETEAHADRFAEQQSREEDSVAESKGLEPANAKESC